MRERKRMAETRLSGYGAAPGLAKGTIVAIRGPGPRQAVTARAPNEERSALLAAIEKARDQIEALADTAGGEAAEMIAFQAAMLADEELARPALEAVAAGSGADEAWRAAMSQESATYAASGDPVLAARTADLDDIRDRVLAHLAPFLDAGRSPPPGAVILAPDLPLSRFLAIDWSGGGAILLTEGSPSGHVAMLARTRGIPMVVGLAGDAGALDGREALVDGASGLVMLDPDPASQAAFAARLGTAPDALARSDRFRLPAMTADGTPVSVHLNINHLAELDGLDPSICEGIGLVRTELLFHGGGHSGLPDEESQYAAYRRIVEWASGRPVVIRVLDAGGDKPIPGITPAFESNPFLGLRGLRLLLRHKALFQTQLRALARAAAFGDLRVLLPMVTIPRELNEARAMLDAVVGDLTRGGIPARHPMLGIMVEVPAAAIGVDRFAAEFFSIGSNDLTQYVTAAGRDIGAVASLADPLNPAVLSLIGTVVRHGLANGLSVSLCGDAAADLLCVPHLLATGLRSLSVPPNAVERTKQAIASSSLAQARP